MQTIVVDDFESAMQALVASYDTDFCAEGISLGEGINLHIKLRGEQWGGELDYRIAEFIIQLQKDVLALYNACNRNNIRYKSERMEKEGLTINVVVSAGCTDLLAQLKGVKDKMNGPQLTAVIIVWLILSYGNQAFSTWQQHVEKSEQKALALEIAEVFERVEHANTSSMVALAKTMEHTDTLSINQQEEMTPHETREKYRSRAMVIDERTPDQFAVDGDYVVETLNRRGNSCVIKLGGKKRKVSLVWLSPIAREQFYAACAKYEDGEELDPMAMQVTVSLAGGVYKEGFIYSLNAPRDGAMSYAEAVQKSIDVVEAMDEED